MKTKYALAFSLLAILISVVACTKTLPKETISSRGVPFGIVINLPRNLNNAEREPNVLKDSSVIVSVPEDLRFFVGPETFPVDELSLLISRRLEGQIEDKKIVYVAGGNLVEFASIVRVLDSARKDGVRTIGLLVDQQGKSSDAPSLFKVQISPEPRPGDPDKAKLLVVSVSRDQKLELNHQPAGTLADTAILTQAVTQFFQESKQQPVAKTIIVKADRSVPYGYVVSAINAVKGAGANPIVLQIDDLPQ